MKKIQELIGRFISTSTEVSQTDDNEKCYPPEVWLNRKELFYIFMYKSGKKRINEVEYDELIDKINEIYKRAFPNEDENFKYGQTASINNMIKDKDYPFAVLKYDKTKDDMLGCEYQIIFLDTNRSDPMNISNIRSLWMKRNLISCLDYYCSITNINPILDDGEIGHNRFLLCLYKLCMEISNVTDFEVSIIGNDYDRYDHSITRVNQVLDDLGEKYKDIDYRIEYGRDASKSNKVGLVVRKKKPGLDGIDIMYNG